MFLIKPIIASIYIKENNFDLERGKPSNAKHLNMETLKQVTDYENIKYEMTHEQIQPITENTKNTSLILAQNKELIEYTNKLKLQLAKSYAAIKQSENMQKENVNLKKEIIKLKVENHRLKNYIAKTFTLC